MMWVLESVGTLFPRLSDLSDEGGIGRVDDTSWMIWRRGICGMKWLTE